MKHLTWMVWTAVAIAAGSGPLAAQGAVYITSSTAGQPLQVSFFAHNASRVKLRTVVKRRDGKRTELPSVLVENPAPNTPIEGPVLPGDAGGATVIVEALDADTGKRLGIDGAPISF